MCAFANSLPQLIVGRIVQALGVCAAPCCPGPSLAIHVLLHGAGHPDDGFGFSGLGLSAFFASTVFVVFGAGFLAPRLARRWGQVSAARAGVLIALSGSVALLVGPEDVDYFSSAMTVFLLGMGLVNPLGTAFTLQPFGQKAGAASALPGFVQTICAAIAIAIVASLAVPLYAAFCIVLTANPGLALVAFSGCARPAIPQPSA